MPTEVLPAELQAKVRSIERHIRTARRAIDSRNWSNAVQSIERARTELQTLPEGSEIKAQLAVTLGNMLREVMGLPPTQEPIPERAPPERPDVTVEPRQTAWYRDNPFFAYPEGAPMPQVKTAGWVVLGAAALFALREQARRNPSGAEFEYQGNRFKLKAGLTLADYAAMAAMGIGILGMTAVFEPFSTAAGLILFGTGAAYLGLKVYDPTIMGRIGMDAD